MKNAESRKSSFYYDKDFYRTGLRGKKLIALLIFVAIMWLLAIINLLCNILLLVFLKLSQQGMESLHFGQDDNGDSVVQFAPAETYLEHVVSRTGTVGGYQGTPLDIEAERVCCKYKPKAKKIDEFQIVLQTDTSSSPVSVVLDDGRVQIQNCNNFLVRRLDSGETIFNAMRPSLPLQKNIKKIATKIVKTKKIRAPVDNSIRLEVENLSFRGNEGTAFRSRAFKLNAAHLISLKTGASGALNFSAPNGMLLSRAIDLPLSLSPSLKADVLGLRLCSCSSTGRLFTVQGNKRCANEAHNCY
ncbi:Sarcoglycan 1 domain containing protein [Trichuris trichiura]|uniref:Beta-sarcoglycan n=1 Tax=Trichuris trichiura TaxID=36087 RepID=A0A077Z7N7_TRITR|nr:Sarcoglycan 1 domain containing protein [Trichuris trichiura]